MSSKMTRRTFMGSAAAAGVTMMIPGRWAVAQDARGASMTAPIQISSGKVRGLVRNGVNQFWGLPYGASTEGANRFMPPVKPAPWAAVRDCFQVGHRAPQDPEGPISEVWSLDRREPDGEDCLTINVFTPGLGTGRRPVMVWLHGGGYAGASGNWLLYDGTNLARKEDVVFVSVNHRLNLFGFLYLADLNAGRKVGELFQCRNAGYCRRAPVDQGKHSNFGGDPGERHDSWPIGRRRQSYNTDGDALGQRTLSSRNRNERFDDPRRSAGHATKAAEEFLARIGVKPNQLADIQKIPFRSFRKLSSRGPEFKGSPDGPCSRRQVASERPVVSDGA